MCGGGYTRNPEIHRSKRSHTFTVESLHKFQQNWKSKVVPFPQVYVDGLSVREIKSRE